MSTHRSVALREDRIRVRNRWDSEPWAGDTRLPDAHVSMRKRCRIGLCQNRWLPYAASKMSDLLASIPTLDEKFGQTRLTMWVRPGLGVSRIDGHFSSEVATAFIDTVDRTIRSSRNFVGLHDWTLASGFDVVVPPRVGGWTVSLLPHIGRIVIATAHPLVSMAVRTTNLSIKRIEHLATREEWLDVVSRAT